MASEQTKNEHDGSPPLAASDFRAAPRRVAPASRPTGLHVCPGCASELVYPTDWAPAAAKSWSVQLRCPDCEWHGGGVYAQEVVDRFDEQLDLGTEELLADLSLLTRANMEEQVDRFVSALHAGWIVPDDF
ncbi:MAG: hypothetical protein QOI10_3234 [Solirubrobacterales bacterium]|jgi:hypothetical protein|nr:hypothetical protein [Solirubrobacterales bacterium]